MPAREHLARPRAVHKLPVVEYLAMHRLFGVLPKAALTELALEIVERSYPKGHFFYREGDPPTHVFILKSGWAILAELDERGHSHPILTLLPGDVFGLATTVLSIRRRADLSALIDAKAFLIPKEAFDDVYRRFPELAYQVARELSWMLCRSERTTFGLTLNRVTSRLARFLVESSEKNGEASASQYRVHLALSHQNLALLVGTSRETVTRVLGRLSRAGLIATNPRQLRILKPEELRRLVAD